MVLCFPNKINDLKTFCFVLFSRMFSAKNFDFKKNENIVSIEDDENSSKLYLNFVRFYSIDFQIKQFRKYLCNSI